MSDDIADKDYDRFLAHRSLLIDVQKHNLATFDKAILTLSSSALGISIVFLDKLGGVNTAQFKLVIVSAWASYLIAVLCNLASYRFGWREAYKQMKLLDERLSTHEEYAMPNPKKHSLTSVLNEASFWSFALGTVFLCLFAYLNIGV